MLRSYDFTVYGNPIGKARPRFVKRGKFVKPYNCQETEEGRFLFEVQKQISANLEPDPIAGPVAVDLVFVLERPKSHFNTKGELKRSAPTYPTKTPDIDNCEKFVLDCLNKWLWRDDAQVVHMTSEKRFGLRPMTEIHINEL